MFNSEKLLIEFSKGTYPSIHNNIFNTIMSLNHNGTIIDACCCYGLLAERLNNSGIKSIGIEKNYTYIQEAKKHNISTHIYKIDILKQMKEFTNIISINSCKTLILRRCLPELFGSNIIQGYSFFEEMHKSGIDTLIIEGRISSSRATNKLSDINKEIDLCVSYFNLVTCINNIAILKIKQ